MSLLIGNNLVVSINYTLTDDDGNIMDSSEGSEPFAYLHGAGPAAGTARVRSCAGGQGRG